MHPALTTVQRCASRNFRKHVEKHWRTSFIRLFFIAQAPGQWRSVTAGPTLTSHRFTGSNCLPRPPSHSVIRTSYPDGNVVNHNITSFTNLCMTERDDDTNTISSQMFKDIASWQRNRLVRLFPFSFVLVHCVFFFLSMCCYSSAWRFI